MLKDPKDMTPEEMQAELAERRQAPPAPSAPMQVQTPAPQQQMSEEQWVDLEEKTGMTRSQIIATNNIAEYHTAPLKAENEKLRATIATKTNVDAALAKARSEDAEFPKYQENVKAYLNRLPADVLSDPVKLDAEMEFAVGYARGKAPRTAAPSEPFGGERFGELDDPDSGAERRSAEDKYFGQVHMSKDMTVRMKTEKIVPDEFRDRHRHPEIEGGVQIKQTDEWKSVENEHRARKYAPKDFGKK